MSLIVVGTVAFDSIKTPVGQADRVVGGAASYIALAASHFVNNQELISVIGEDFPANFLEELCSRGVNQGGLKLVEGEKSFFWEGSYHDDLIGRDTLVTCVASIILRFAWCGTNQATSFPSRPFLSIIS